MENRIKMDDLGVPLFSETSIYIYYIYTHNRVVIKSSVLFFTPSLRQLLWSVETTAEGQKEREVGIDDDVLSLQMGVKIFRLSMDIQKTSKYIGLFVEQPQPTL